MCDVCLCPGILYSGQSKHYAEHRIYYRGAGIYFPAAGPHGERARRDSSNVRHKEQQKTMQG